MQWIYSSINATVYLLTDKALKIFAIPTIIAIYLNFYFLRLRHKMQYNTHQCAMNFFLGSCFPFTFFKHTNYSCVNEKKTLNMILYNVSAHKNDLQRMDLEINAWKCIWKEGGHSFVKVYTLKPWWYYSLTIKLF